ncbi:MAG: AAA family ATPase [Thermoguttaceae bacterium]
MYISRLVAKNWRNFSDIDVPLCETVYLVGPNASGKSNFLDIFRFFRDVVNPKGGGLQKAVSDRGGVKKVRSLSARKVTQIELGIELKEDLDKPIPDWAYSLSFQGKSNGKDTRVKILSEEVKHKDIQVLKRPEKEDDNDSERLTQTFLEQINSNRDFREIADFLKNTLYLHLVPQLLKYGNQLAVQMIESDPFGQGFLEEIASESEKTRSSRLKQIGNILQRVVPQFKKLEFVKDDKTGKPHLQILFEHWRGNGAYQREDQFSDGTLRLIALLWTLRSSDNLLLLEEPELSLHGPIVEQIPHLFHLIRASRKIAGGQIFVSTHSERMLFDKSLGANSFLIVQPGSNGESSQIRPLTKNEKEMIKLGISPADVVFPITESSIGRM